MRCDSRASFLGHTFVSSCLGHEPKARVVIAVVVVFFVINQGKNKMKTIMFFSSQTVKRKR
jgi:hypothetical protein